MTRKRICSSIFLLAVLALNGHAQNTKVITGATLIDGTGRAPIKDAVIVIEGTRISVVGTRAKVKIPKGAQMLDARGKYVIPGLADMHNHLGRGDISGARRNLKQNLAHLLGWGITMVFDTGISMADFAELKSAAAEDTSPYPRFFAVAYFTAKGGYGGTSGSYMPDRPEEARANVREAKAVGVDAVKIAYDDMARSRKPLPMLKYDVLAAIIDEAHKQGLKAYSHVTSLQYAKEFLRAGGDGLVHSVSTDLVDAEFISLMRKNKAVYIPTLSMFETMAGEKPIASWVEREANFDLRRVIAKEVYAALLDPATPQRLMPQFGEYAYAYIRAHRPILMANVKKLFDAGVVVVCGTDTGVPGVLLGVASQMEPTLYVEAGLTPAQALRTATINAARMIGRETDLGTVEAGKLADLVILDADPLADISNIRQLNRVIKGGVVYDPAVVVKSTVN